ncbi:MAG: SUMF1/EgtB/PvdO family nonheme iron enzyme [Treponema sp.]|jgi:formylglycine-generating enzyme required for sulfatase activity|nr:SUMF1/EgtB/PvdO family nonheme iron enzyme [Treponema sp.]
MPEKNHPAASAPEDQVHLKPILGIRPGVYIAIMGALVLVLALFFLLLYPGIARPGAMVVFTSDPSGSALRVDDVYAGTSPCRVFVPRGEHILEAVLPGFETKRLDAAIPGRLFASVLFPRRYDLNVKLTAPDPAAVLAASAHDYAAWSFGGEPTPAWQIPLSLSEGVYRIGSAAANINSSGILAAAARFAVTRAALRDLVRADTLALNGGNVPSPLTLTRSVTQALAFLSDNPAGAAWLADTLPPDSAALLISSAWYQNQLAAFADVTAGESLAAAPGGQSDPDLPASQIRVGGLLFTGVGGGVLVQGEPFPHRVPVPAFMICATEILSPAYADFLDAVPAWRADQRETLEQQGLVTDEYLADFESTVPAGRGRIDRGVSSVSWYAAKAYCEWLSGKLPASFAGWEIRLPTEAEWEYAVKSAQKWGGRGIFIPDGGVWEWCADSYSPLPFFAAPPEAIAAAGSPERSLRGGSSFNNTGLSNPETRASLPPAACSSFVSFRPVIARSVSVSR